MPVFGPRSVLLQLEVMADPHRKTEPVEKHTLNPTKGSCTSKEYAAGNAEPWGKTNRRFQREGQGNPDAVE